MQISRSRRACWAVALVVTAVLIVPVAGGIAAATEASAFPAQLVGRWTRTVTATDLKREGVTDPPAGTVFTLTIMKSGAASLSGKTPGVKDQTPPFTGPIVPAGANRVHINVAFAFPNVYRWRVSGRLLTFTKISDNFHTNAAVFSGVWKRK